jgi:hypothetical protein
MRARELAQYFARWVYSLPQVDRFSPAYSNLERAAFSFLIMAHPLHWTPFEGGYYGECIALLRLANRSPTSTNLMETQS